MDTTKRKSGKHGAKQPPPTAGARMRRWLKQHRSWFWTLGVLGALAAAIVYFADPFGSYTAVDASGKNVETGIIKTDGASPRQRRPAPDFLLADYDGKAVKLDDFRGKTVLLNWWATWCKVCEAEMPDMQRLASENRDDLVILAINRGEGTGIAKSWSDARGLTALKFVMDKNEDVARGYKLGSSMPNSFFVDKDGIVRVVKIGGMQYSEMKQLLAETRQAAGKAN